MVEFAKRVFAFNGGSQPKCGVVLADDTRYVAKLTTDSPIGLSSKQNVNELLGYSLAKIVGLRTPQHTLVEISAQSNRDQEVISVPSGIYFASKIMPAEYQPLPEGETARELLGRCDQAQVYRLHALDVLLKIPDRKASDVLVHSGTGSRELIAIDFGNSLGGSHWTPDELRASPLSVAGPHSAWLFRSGLDDSSALERAAAQVSRASNEFAEAIAGINCCDLTVDEQDAALEFLQTRSGSLDMLITKDLAERCSER